MKDKRVEFESSGLKCDNCDYYNGDVESKDYINHINEPCPKCGENLLTQSDYDLHLKLIDAVNFVNNLSEESLNKLGIASGDESNEKVFRVDLHDGVKFTEE